MNNNKMASYLLLVLLATTALTSGSESSDGWEAEYEAGINKILEEQPELVSEFLSDYNRQIQNDRSIVGDEFHCTPFKAILKPASVHNLRPADIDVVAAMGDSLTAGCGINAKLIAGIVTNYRGLSWSIGGSTTYEDGAHTLANVLKKYNHHLTGYALGTSRVDDIDLSRLNVAIGGSIAPDMPAQSHALVERLRDFSDVDFVDDWKMVTFFIGGNDLCRWCLDEAKFSTQAYVSNIREALDILHETVPRMLVNIVAIFDVTPLDEVGNEKASCKAFHSVACSCGLGATKEHTTKLAREYADAIEDLVLTGRYDTRDDFTVVYQPFMRDMDIPRYPDGTPDLTYMAPDCFHFSQKGHNSIATFLWNALFQPVGKKQTMMNFRDAHYCPTEHQLIQTNMNREASKVEGPDGEVKEKANSAVVVACGVVLSVGVVLIFVVLGVVAYRNHHTQSEKLRDVEKQRKRAKYDHKMMTA